MSMMRCEGCGEMVDTDYNPFYYNVEIGYVTMNLCERCRMFITEDDDIGV